MYRSLCEKRPHKLEAPKYTGVIKVKKLEGRPHNPGIERRTISDTRTGERERRVSTYKRPHGSFTSKVTQDGGLVKGRLNRCCREDFSGVRMSEILNILSVFFFFRCAFGV